MLIGCEKETKRILIDELTNKGSIESPLMYFESSLFNGIAFDIYENGELKAESYYKDGKRDGLTKQWYDNGQLMVEMTFKNGEQDGLSKQWYQNGQLMVEMTFKNGKQDGLTKQWYDNGQLMVEMTFKNGKQDGLSKQWYQNGDEILLNQKEEETETKEEKIVSTKEIATQSVEKTLKEEKTQKVGNKAIYTPKESGGKSDGEGDREGKGAARGAAGGGGGGGGSGDYQLGDREAIEKPKPLSNQAEGKVVVIINVDRLGNVIYAIPGAAGSTTLNNDLLERAKKAALKTKFEPDPEAPENQQGKIIYDFRLN